MMPEQGTLFAMPASECGGETIPEATAGAPKLKVVDRNQFKMLALDVDTLVGTDHKVRAIWELTGRLDLSKFLMGVRSKKGCPGREHNDPRLLVALWLYAYSEGISSARQVSRQMEYEPALRWLTGLEAINHTTLSEFRTAHQEALNDLFTELLAVLDTAGLVDLEQVMHDGTKIQAQGSGSSFRREKTVRTQLEKARQVVEELGDPEDEQKQSRRDAARQRVAREKVAVLEHALEELEEIRRTKHTVKEKADARVSVTEPEARRMKHGNDGGIAPSYNVQITTDAQQKVIVAVDLTQSSSDGEVALVNVVKAVEENLGRPPVQMVTDGGFTNQKNIVGLDHMEVDLIGSQADPEERKAAARHASGITEEFAGDRFQTVGEGGALVCPQGQRLELVGQSEKRGNTYDVYRAPGSVCRQCEFHAQCCPKGYERGRTVTLLVSEVPEVVEFRKKMETEAAKQAYKRRSEVAESPNAWIKEKFGIRKFRLCGLAKAGIEALWACLTYNVMQWIRLVWRKGNVVLPQAT
jgi:transposase